MSPLLLLGVSLSEVVVAQEQFITLKGTITSPSTTGSANVPNARVQIMDPDSPKAKRVLRSTTADRAADYEIENVAEGKYDIVACDDLLTYKPKRQTVEVRRNGHEVNFSLRTSDRAHPLPRFFGKSMVVYLKHIETGCEFDAMPANGDGIVSFPNTVDETTLYSKYAVCVDDTKEVDSPSPFESCLKRLVPLGLTKDQVVDTSRLGKPDKIKRGRGDQEWIYVYKDVKVTLVHGKVSEVKVEIEPTPCFLGMDCASN